MSPPEVWGPPIWTLFHVLAEKINENAYPFFVKQLFDVIKMICSALPCPECTQDAIIFLGKIKLQDLKTKNDFKNMIYIFHNHVNVKKRKPLYNYSNLEKYKKYNIINVLNRFISVYHTRGNMNLLAESFRRQLIVKNIKNWFNRNFRIFAPSQPVNNNSVLTVESEEMNVIIDEDIIIIESPLEPTVEPSLEPPLEPSLEPTVEPSLEPPLEPTVEPTTVTTEEPIVIEPQKTKKGRKKKIA